MISHTNSSFWKLYRKLPQTIREIAKKQYKLFAIDAYRASLHFKRVHLMRPIYSARITRNYRAVDILEDNIIVWFWVGSHNEYDKLLKK